VNFCGRKNVFDYVNFTDVYGESTGHDLKLFALSTCGFCRRAIEFLRNNNISYSNVYVDQLPVSIKQRLKDEFSERFKKTILYPALIIDEKDVLIGFTEEVWIRNLGIEK
jgi:glutaredoxin-like protein NrdH